jgi:hypothetical protein
LRLPWSASRLAGSVFAFGWQGPCTGGGGGIGDGGHDGGGGTVDGGPRELHSDPKDKDCAISVSFNGTSTVTVQAGAHPPNGPSEVNTKSGPLQGVGFTVSGSVPSGEIGMFGNDSTNPKHPSRAWTVQQWRSNSTQTNTGINNSDEKAVQELDTRVPHSITGKNFQWYDHPGIPSSSLQWNPLKNAVGKWNFFVKAVNGKKECSVSFFINVMFDGTNWHAEWGEIKP